MTVSPVSARRRRRSLLAVLVVAVVIVVAVVVVIARGVNGLFGGDADYTGTGTGSVIVHVESGDTETAIGETLVHDGVVASAGAFTSAASGNAKAADIQPGYYRLRHHMSGAAAVKLLVDPSSVVNQQVVIPEGFTAAEIVARIAADTTISTASLQAAIAHPAGLGLPAYANGKVEGLLYPATYEFAPGTTATQALAQMVARFRQEATDLDLAKAARQEGLTPYQAVILASILEHEYKLPADLTKIAEVFLNRHRQGRPLGSNATLAYVLGHAPTSESDLHLASPYNTEFSPGFPPTPIGSPGELTLNAVLHPASGNLLYFVIVDKAGHAAFASTDAGYQRISAQAHANGLH